MMRLHKKRQTPNKSRSVPKTAVKMESLHVKSLQHKITPIPPHERAKGAAKKKGLGEDRSSFQGQQPERQSGAAAVKSKNPRRVLLDLMHNITQKTH